MQGSRHAGVPTCSAEFCVCLLQVKHLMAQGCAAPVNSHVQLRSMKSVQQQLAWEMFNASMQPLVDAGEGHPAARARTPKTLLCDCCDFLACLPQCLSVSASQFPPWSLWPWL